MTGSNRLTIQRSSLRVQPNVSKLETLDPVEKLRQAFPEVDPGLRPYGSRVLVQIRRPKRVSDGGVLYADDSRETIKWNTQIGKVIALGPLAFRSRQVKDGAELPKVWPEGEWCKPGDFVRVPKHGGDRWEVPLPEDGHGYENAALFVIFNDLDLIGQVTGDPLAVRAYV